MKTFRPFFYGLAELSPAAIDVFLKVYLLLFFNQIVGLSATGTSLVIGLSVLWDAVTDPLIGAFSDRFKEKHGYRKRILYLAGLSLSLFFFCLWRTPVETQISSYVLLFFLCALLNSSLSFFSVPYYAVANDLEKNDLERRKWIGWRIIFFNVGSLVGLSVPAYFLTHADVSSVSKQPYLQAVTVLALVTLVLSGLATYLMYLKTTGVLAVEKNKSLTLKFILKDKVFLQVLSAFFIVNCGLGLNSTLALYYYKEFLNFTQEQTQIIIISFLVIFTLSIPLWVILTKYFDKKNLIFFGALVLGLITIFSFPFFPKDSFWLVFVVASALCGVLVGVAVVMEIYLADYLNKKESDLKQSVSGQFLGLWKMASKVSRGIAIGLAGPIIEISKGNPQMLANYFGGVVGFFFIFAGLIFLVKVNHTT